MVGLGHGNQAADFLNFLSFSLNHILKTGDLAHLRFLFGLTDGSVAFVYKKREIPADLVCFPPLT